VIDYCTNTTKIKDSFTKSFNLGFISMASNNLLNAMPVYPNNPFNMNKNNIIKLADAKNIFFIINPDTFSSRFDYILKLRSLNHDTLMT
jgi:cysteinyl-tRNA synthetase